MADDAGIEFGLGGKQVSIGLYSVVGKKEELRGNSLSSVPAETEDEIDKRVGMVAGTKLHYLLQVLLSNKVVPGLDNQTILPVTENIQTFKDGVVYEADESDLNFRLLVGGAPVPNINISNKEGLQKYFTKRWEDAQKLQEAFIHGVRKLPYMDDKYIVIPEPRLCPQIENLQQLGALIFRGVSEYEIVTQPDETGRKHKISLNLYNLMQKAVNHDLGKGQLEEPASESIKDNTSWNDSTVGSRSKTVAIEDLLYNVLIRNQPVLKYFPDVVKKFDRELENKYERDKKNNPQAKRYFSEDLLIYLQTDESDLALTDLIRNKQINMQELADILTLRLLSIASREIDFFIGGRSSSDSVQKEDLIEMLKELCGEDSRFDPKYIDQVRDRLPEQKIEYRDPSNIRPDAIIFEVPDKIENSQENKLKDEFRHRFRQFIMEEYKKNHWPSLLTNMKFFELLDEGVGFGMTIRTLDLKTSLFPMGNDIKKYEREMTYYAITLAQGLVAYRRWKDPSRPHGVLELIRDPILRAHKSFEILEVAMTRVNDEIGAKFKLFVEAEKFSGENLRPSVTGEKAVNLGGNDVTVKTYNPQNLRHFRQAWERIVKKIMVARSLYGME